MKRILLLIIALLVNIYCITAQDHLRKLLEQADEVLTKHDAGMLSRQDSIVMAKLKLEIDRLKLEELIRQNMVDQTLHSVIPPNSPTQGIPLIVENDTVLMLYASLGGISIEDRIDYAERQIANLGKSITSNPILAYLLENEHTTDIMARGKVILTVTNADALSQNTDRQTLSNLYLTAINSKIAQLHEEYSLASKLKGVVLALIVLAMQIAIIFFTNKLFRRLKYNICRKRHQLHPWKFKNYVFFNIYNQVRVYISLVRCIRFIIIAIQLIITILIIFYIFPETKSLAYSMFHHLWTPVRDILDSIIGYIPKLLKIIIIYICFRYINKVLKYFTKEIASGKLHIHGFYDDWAFPTYYIVRVLLYSFMFVMIWPLLPNSDSPVFQGISVFVGLVVSLGSTTVIGNVMAGMVLTYMRSFKVGDEIKLNDGVSGTVIEKTPFVTRIHTTKNKVITIPNSAVMGAYTINYTVSARDEGVIIYSNISASYEVDRLRVEELLIAAALKTKGVLTEQSPYVLVTKLDDFYCYYQINAYTKNIHDIESVYSSLHSNIIDQFHEAGIEILAPHYFAQRDGSDTVMPPKYMK